MIFLSDVYSLCVAYPEPLADRLYNETKDFIKNHVDNILKTQVTPGGRIATEDTPNADESQLLNRYFSAWTVYSKGVEFLNYLYL